MLILVDINGSHDHFGKKREAVTLGKRRVGGWGAGREAEV